MANSKKRKTASKKDKKDKDEDEQGWSIGASVAVCLLVVVMAFTILGLVIAVTSKEVGKESLSFENSLFSANI